MLNTYDELRGDTVVVPVNISNLYLFTDSMVRLHRLESHACSFENHKNLPVFVRNHLKRVVQKYYKVPVKFRYIAGSLNPADATTKSLSVISLKK